MTKDFKRYNYYIIPLLFCVFQLAGINAFGQKVDTVSLRDSLINREGPQARARRNRNIDISDSTQLNSISVKTASLITALSDLIMLVTEDHSFVADSIEFAYIDPIEDLLST